MKIPIRSTKISLLLFGLVVLSGAHYQSYSEKMQTLHMKATSNALEATLRLPKNVTPFQTFSMQVNLKCTVPEDCIEPHIQFDAAMPGHGHGMNYVPTIERVSNNQFEVKGLRLHMAGFWEIYLDVQAKKDKYIIHRMQTTLEI